MDNDFMSKVKRLNNTIHSVPIIESETSKSIVQTLQKIKHVDIEVDNEYNILPKYKNELENLHQYFSLKNLICFCYKYLDDEELKEEYIYKYNKEDYKKYLQSSWWFITSEIIKNIYSKCVLCGSEKHLNVHHSNYEYIGCELNHIDSMAVLCGKCHNNFHKKG